MSKNVAMFVDVANLYYAARGQDVDVDYVALLKHATKGRDLIRAYAYSGLDPENENQRKFIDFLGKNGYKVIHKDIRKFGDGRVKANLDIELVVDLFRLADRMDIAVIVSGDGDFAPAIKALQDQGIRCEVISFRPNTSSDLIAVADEFLDIMKVAGIGRKREGREAGMSMPEMPAKEVVPEFGFREASPSVAAAALAALKSTDSPRTNGRSRRGRRGGTDDQPATEVALVEVAAAAEGGDTVRRRRRRRGGRGRGRGRRTAESSAAAAPPGDMPVADNGWEEIDDLSRLEGLGEEREYTFQEADEETLRELNLLEPGIESGAAPPGEGPTPPAKRRTSRGGRASRVAASAEGAAPAEPRPSSRAARGSSRAAGTGSRGGRTRGRRASQPAPEDAGSDAETSRSETSPTEAPTRRSRGPRANSAEEQDAQAVEPQGIWERFRSGRRAPRQT